MHLPITPEMAKAYQDILLHEAQGNHLAGQVKAAGPRLQDRLLVKTGNWLIATGLMLHERARPSAPALPDTYRSATGKVSA
jgi:hypothetical protein